MTAKHAVRVVGTSRFLACDGLNRRERHHRIRRADFMRTVVMVVIRTSKVALNTPLVRPNPKRTKPNPSFLLVIRPSSASLSAQKSTLLFFAFERAELENTDSVYGLQTREARFRTVADRTRAETRAAVSYGFLEFFRSSGRTTKKPRATRRARGDTHSLFRTMAVKQMHAATPATRDAAACASLPLKCPSPVTLEAMHIARQCGVLTDLEVGSAGDGRNPSRRVSGALVGSVLRYDEEKENIDPVTGVHARLASGVAAGTNARGASRLSSNRAIATLSVFYRARSFSRFELTRDPPPPNARRRLGSSIVPRHRAWGD